MSSSSIVLLKRTEVDEIWAAAFEVHPQEHMENSYVDR